VVIREPAVLKKIGQIAQNGRFIAQASACIAVFCKETKYYLEDGCAATQNILLAATDSGIGSCWVAGDKKPYCEEVAKLLGAPLECKLVSLISLGFPKSKDSFRVINKRVLKEVLHWEKF
jgi:nitroreductase